MLHGQVWPQLNVRWMARAARSLYGVRKRPNRRLEAARPTSFRAPQQFLVVLLGTIATGGLLALLAADWFFLVPYSLGLFAGFSPAFMLTYWRVSALVGLVLLGGAAGMLLYDDGEPVRVSEPTDEQKVSAQEASPQPIRSSSPLPPSVEGEEAVSKDTATSKEEATPKEETPKDVVLPGIPFAFNGQTLPSASLPALDETVRILNENPQISVLIEGYSDAVGSEPFNLELSRNRAEAVRAYLVEGGIAAERLRVVGRGELNPLAPNTKDDGSDNPAGRAINRRVELSVE